MFSNYKHLLDERWKTIGHLAVRSLLMVIVFFQVNFLGCKYYQTKDYSRMRKFTLSDQTKGVVGEMASPVLIISAFLGSSDVLPEVNGVVHEFDRIGGDFVEVENLDLSRSRNRIAELRDQYEIDINRDQLIIVSESGRTKVIQADELVARDPETGRILEFRGEERITSALMEVTGQQQKKIYLVYGNRSFDQLAPIAEQLQNLVRSQNARLENLLLSSRQSIPSDADALFFPGNSADITKREAEMVRDFWENRGGGILVLLDPAAKTPNLNSLIGNNGVVPRRDRVLTVRSIPGLGYRKFYNAPVTIIPGMGPNRDLSVMAFQLMDRTQSLVVQSSEQLYLTRNIKSYPLLIVDPSFWGETEFDAQEVSYNPDSDNGRPENVYAAAAVEKSKTTNEGEMLSRMVVVGNPNLLSPEGNTQKTAADFCTASLNWVMNREQMLGIAPRNPTVYNLYVGDGTFGLLQTIVVWVIPTALLFCGTLVWYRRRA